MSEELNPYAIVERIKNSGSIIKSLRSGKPDASTTAVVQECITLLQNLNHQSDVVVAGLKFMHDALAAAPHTSTLIRLEGGIKIFFKILRTNNSDSQITALSASVLHRCCAASNVTLMTLAKEKSLGSTLISAISSHTNNASVMGPIFDLLALVTNHPRGASQLAEDGLVVLCKELLVNFLGNWPIFGMVLKVVKNMAKHDGPCAALARNPNMGRLLLGVARMLARLPEQRKLLKRTSRALWLLNRSSLTPLPPMEPSLPISQGAPHLNLLSALDADLQRHMELFPEEYPQQAPSPVLSPPPPPQQQYASTAGGPGDANTGSNSTHVALSVQAVPASLLPHLQPVSTAGVGVGSYELSPAPSAASSDQPSPGSEGFHAWGTTDASSSVADADRVHTLGGSNLDTGSAAEERVGGGWQGCVRTVRTMRQPPVPPPSAAAQTAAGVQAAAAAAEGQGAGGVLPEPFHNCGGGTLGLDMMMHDLRRLVHPEAVINRRVYLNVPERQPSGRQRVDEEKKQGSPTPPTTSGHLSKAKAARQAAAAAAAPVPDSTQFGDQLLATAVRRGHILSPPSHPPTLGPASTPSGLRTGSGSWGSQGAPLGSLSSLGKGPLIPRGYSQAFPPLGGVRRSLVPEGARSSPTSFSTSNSTSSVARPGGGPIRGGGGMGSSLDSAAFSGGGIWMGGGPEASAIGGGVGNVPRPLPPLEFESNFESGNLRAAVQVYENEYDLFLATDLNDRSEGGNLCQWFYFAVTGVQPGVPYKFNLVNFRKKQSLFASGMQPLVCCCRHSPASSSNNDFSISSDHANHFNHSSGPNSSGSTSTSASSNLDGRSSVGKEEGSEIHTLSGARTGARAEGAVGPDGPASHQNSSSLCCPPPHNEQHSLRQGAGNVAPSTISSLVPGQQPSEGHASGSNLAGREGSVHGAAGSAHAALDHHVWRGGAQGSAKLVPSMGTEAHDIRTERGTPAPGTRSSLVGAEAYDSRVERGTPAAPGSRGSLIDLSTALPPGTPPKEGGRGLRGGALVCTSTFVVGVDRGSGGSSSRGGSGSLQALGGGGREGLAVGGQSLKEGGVGCSREGGFLELAGGANGLGSRGTTKRGGSTGGASSLGLSGNAFEPQPPPSRTLHHNPHPRPTPPARSPCTTPTPARHPEHQQQLPQPQLLQPLQQQHRLLQPQSVWGGLGLGLIGSTPGTWVRMGSHVAYYPSPYRGRPTTASPFSEAPKRGLKKSSATTTSLTKKSSGRSNSSSASSNCASGPNAFPVNNPPALSNAQPFNTGGSSSGTGSATSAGGPGSGKGGGKGGEATAAGPPAGDAGPGLYCCTFTLQFPEADATYYVAPCYPYTYSDLQEYLDRLTARLSTPGPPPSTTLSAPLPQFDQHQHHQQQIQRQQQHQQQQQQQFLRPLEVSSLQLRPRSPYLNPAVPNPSTSPLEGSPVPPLGGMLVRSLLCYTLAGHRVECLTITDFRAPLEVVRQREAIVLTARVHPGESNASWIMQGVLDFLTSDAPAAHTLRRSFVFKIVPMLNPDGVINGSYRCSLAGVDLNRMWEHPLKFQHPSVYHSKKLLAQLAAACRLALYIDIHGHSTKEDAFFYGCEPNLAGLDKTPPAPYPQPGPTASPPFSSPSRPNPMTSRPGGTAFEVDAPMPGGYITTGSDGLDWGAPGSLAAMPMLATSAAPHGAPPSLSVSGSAAHWQAHPQQQQQQQQQHEGAAWPQAQGPVFWPNSSSSPGGAAAAPAPAPAGLCQPPSARQAARLRVRMLPYLASCISSDFSLPKCGFRIRKAKLGAARVVANRELGCAGAYTLEASLGGRALGRSHFSAADYISLGENLCRGVAALAEVDDAALLEDMARNVTLPSASST